MRKVLLLLVMTLFMGSMFVGCTPTQLQEDETAKAIDPDKICPPNDRNCNGIPDDEE